MDSTAVQKKKNDNLYMKKSCMDKFSLTCWRPDKFNRMYFNHCSKAIDGTSVKDILCLLVKKYIYCKNIILFHRLISYCCIGSLEHLDTVPLLQCC